MPTASDNELKKLISESAIKRSLIPVIICDGDLKVCIKSTGASNLLPKPSVGSSILPHMPENTAEKIFTGPLPISTFLETPGGKLFTVITEGQAEGIKYYALIPEPEISVLSAEVPQYIADSYSHLSDAVRELISVPLAPASRLEHSVTAMCRLNDFFDKSRLGTLSATSGYTDICAELESVVREYSELLSTVGAAINFRNLSGQSLISAYPAEIIHIFASVLTAAALIVSSDGRPNINCAAIPGDGSMARISIDITVSDELTGIKNFHELAVRVVPLCLELAAIEDIAARHNFKLDCSIDGHKLNINCDIGIISHTIIKLHTPIRHAENSRLHRTVAELLSVALAARNARFVENTAHAGIITKL